MPTKKKTAGDGDATNQVGHVAAPARPAKKPAKAKAAAKDPAGAAVAQAVGAGDAKLKAPAKAKAKPKAKPVAAKAPGGKATKSKALTVEPDEVEAPRPRGRRNEANSLVIVESPAKAKTIKKYLGAGYIVKASVGHVKDLPKKTMGIDIEHGFAPEYVVIDGKRKVLAEIKDAAALVGRVLLAPDPIAKGKPSPGTSPRRCAAPTPTSSACSSTRSPRRPSTRRSASRWRST